MQRVESTLRTRYWSWTFHRQTEIPGTLLDVLSLGLPHISRDSWEQRFAFGGVYINGREVVSDATLPVPCKIEYYEPKFEISRAAELYPTLGPEDFVLRDDDLAVVWKPAKLPSMPAKEQRHFSAKASIELITGCTIHMPSRLDVSVQGLVLVSLSERMHPLLQQLFESRGVTKHYRLASDRFRADRTWSTSAKIARDPAHPVLRSASDTIGQSAETRFSFVRQDERSANPSYIYDAFPITGRTHQIRVHSAHCGIPILGDNFYGGCPSPELHLVSYSVAFTHPITRQRVAVVAPKSHCPSWAVESDL